MCVIDSRHTGCARVCVIDSRHTGCARVCVCVHARVCVIDLCLCFSIHAVGHCLALLLCEARRHLRTVAC